MEGHLAKNPAARRVAFRVIVLVAIGWFIRSDAMGQTTRLEAGLQIGPGLGWLRGNEGIGRTKGIIGPVGGLTVQYNLSRELGVRLGAYYQQKGYRSDILFVDINGNEVGSGDLDFKLDYLTIPLMLRYSSGEKLMVSVGVGGYSGILLSARQTVSGFNAPEQTVTDDFDTLDLGICVSVGGAMACGERIDLNAELRFDMGLANISALPVVGDGSVRTNAVCLLVGCSYRFGSALTP